MRQRVMIAMALACDPALLIADEPTTALDVTIQAQMLDLHAGAQRRDAAAAIMLITHDLGVVADIADASSSCMPAEIVEEAAGCGALRAPRIRTRSACCGSIPRLRRRAARA